MAKTNAKAARSNKSPKLNVARQTRTRKPLALAETIEKVLNAKIEYRERGQTRFASAQELSIKMLVDRAVSGDLEAAEIVLKIRERAERYGDAGVEQIEISDWLPDHPGQSGEQKAQDLKASRNDETQSAP
jgi:hypothetical protein